MHTQSGVLESEGRRGLIKKTVLAELKTLTRGKEDVPMFRLGRSRDMVDAAQAAERLERNVINEQRRVSIIQNLQKVLILTQNGWEGDCLDCGEEIPLERIKKVPGVGRCVICQTAFEKINKRRR